MRLTGDGPHAPRPPVRRPQALRLMAVGLVFLGLAVAIWLSVSYPGRKLTSQVLELTGQWPQALSAPDEIVAHVVSPRGPGVLLLPGSFSIAEKPFRPNSDEGRAVAALFDDGKLSRDHKTPTDCDPQGDFALEFKRGITKRQVIFDLACGVTDGDSGIHSFDVRAVAELASTFFPDVEAFDKVYRGEQIR